MTTRDLYSDLTDPPPAGLAFLAQYSARLGTLFNAASFPVIDVGGSADEVTGNLSPPLDSGLIDGMKATIGWVGANTGGVTLALDGGPAIPVLDAAGGALLPGAIGPGLRSQLEYVGGAWRMLSPNLLMAAAGGGGSWYWTFTATGTLTLPEGLDDNRLVIVSGWGSGGGGGFNCGGGGGAFGRLFFRRVQLPASVTVTVAHGGAAQTAGSASTFGALASFAGGGGGSSTASGGGGAGLSDSGANGVSTNGGAGGFLGGGKGSDTNSATVGHASHPWAGGGGAANSNPGGRSIWGGGGGSGSSAAAGTSVWGGSGGGGGSTPTAGNVPAGGGGRGQPGGRGEVHVLIP